MFCPPVLDSKKAPPFCSCPSKSFLIPAEAIMTPKADHVVLCSKPLNGTAAPGECLPQLTRPWDCASSCCSSLPALILGAWPSSPSNLALAPLAPDTHLPSLPRMLPGGSCVLFLHLCSICARCPLFSGSFAHYLPHPFCPFSSLTLHAGLHVSALFLLHH